jgi:hypothetical protein
MQQHMTCCRALPAALPSHQSSNLTHADTRPANTSSWTHHSLPHALLQQQRWRCMASRRASQQMLRQQLWVLRLCLRSACHPQVSLAAATR